MNAKYLCLALGLAVLVAIPIAISSRLTPASNLAGNRPRLSMTPTALPISTLPGFSPSETKSTVSPSVGLQLIAQSFGVSFRVVSEPGRRPELPPLHENFTKVVSKFAHSLRLPVVSSNAFASDLVLTSGGLIAGDAPEVLIETLHRLGQAAPGESAAIVSELAALRDKRLETVFVGVLRDDSEPQARSEAAAALQEAERPESRLALVQALADPDPWVVDNARVSIQRIGPSVMTPYLKTLLHGTNAAARMEAGDLLERVFHQKLPEKFWATEPSSPTDSRHAHAEAQ